MALLTALMAMLMMVALGAGLTLTTMTESSIAANHRDGVQTLYAAEAGIELAISRLRTTPDWDAVVRAGSSTPFVAVRLADLAQSSAIDPRFTMVVTVAPDPNGHPDVLVLQSSAGGPGGNRRIVEVTVRRMPPDANGARAIETSSWR
jgi:hypothetical protein